MKKFMVGVCGVLFLSASVGVMAAQPCSIEALSENQPQFNRVFLVEGESIEAVTYTYKDNIIGCSTSAQNSAEYSCKLSREMLQNRNNATLLVRLYADDHVLYECEASVADLMKHKVSM